MNIEYRNPPHFWLFKLFFPVTPYTLFAYKGTIYCQPKAIVTPDLEIHEAQHFVQQRSHKLWLLRYLLFPSFRFDMELQAYRAQWAFIMREVKDREMRTKMLLHMADDLSSPLYGSLCTKDQAMRYIKFNGVNVYRS